MRIGKTEKLKANTRSRGAPASKAPDTQALPCRLVVTAAARGVAYA